MADIEETVTIASSRDLVWSALADFGAIAQWAPNVAHSCLTTEQRDGVGAVRRVQIGRNALLEEVLEWEPATRLAYRIDGLPPVVRSVINTWEITGDGASTSVSLASQVDAGPRPPQQLAARLFAKAMAKASREMLAGLKNHIEEAA